MQTIIDYDPFKPGKMDVRIFNPNTGNLTNVASCDPQKLNEAYNTSVKVCDRSAIPPAVRWISPRQDIVVWERPPHYVTFQFSDAYQRNLSSNRASQHSVRIALPWQYYVIGLTKNNKIANIYMFFGYESLRSLRSQIYVPPLLNFYSDCKLCQAAYTEIQEYDSSLSDILDTVYKAIWHSGFNHDLVENVNSIPDNHPLRHLLPNYELFYKRWGVLTINEVLELPLQPVNHSIRSLIDLGIITASPQTHSSAGEELGILLTMAAQDAESMV